METPPPGGRGADALLAQRLVERRPDAVAEAYRLHGDAVHGLARRLCGDRADDVAQDVFVRLWDRPDAYDPERASLRTFLLMQARSRSIDLLRSDVARQRREAADGADRSDRPDPALGGSDAGASTVLRLLDRLPTVQREAIALAFVQGHTYRDVAVLLGQAEGTVKGRIRSGLRTLRELMVQEGGDLAPL